MKYSALVRQATENALAIAFQHEERISRFGSDMPLSEKCLSNQCPNHVICRFILTPPSAGPAYYILLALTKIKGAKLEQPLNRAARSQENSEFSY
jgi:hypothetical protein